MIFGRRALVTLVLAVAMSVPAVAQDAKAVPESRAEMQLSFAPLVKQTANAVVNVYAERVVERRSIFSGDPFFEEFFGQRMPNRSEKQSSLGSGVIVGRNGLVVTNNHVIEGADDIKVALADGRELPCKIMLKDDRVDLAVLKIQSDGPFEIIPIGDSDAVEVGDLVLAMGNPFGVGQTVTSGIVSALARNQITSGDFGFFIQTDAAINPGNSGGGLIDMKGQLIGINTAIFSRGGGSNGVGFAIPANLVKAFVASAEGGGGSFVRPFIGATFEPVTSEVAEALGLDRARGALVTAVAADGPAAAAGIKPGQVVTAVNGIAVEHPDALGYRLTTVGVGHEARVTISENGKTHDVVLKLEQAPETSPRDERLIEGRNPFAGAVVANLSPRLAEELRMPTSLRGVVVTEINRGSPAARIGLEPKDIVRSVNGTEIDTSKTLESVTAEDASLWRVEIERDGQIIRQFFK
ncbi:MULTISPECIES: DegQ family serine endoprotease [unclassified Sinorhizobium]|uniref:DegQ family serine endoprotease n=1 Tax=unclassified Sinorhizobium TaxID=2613772 RepID=UPI0024C2890D|nr:MULTISPECIES: DegQ family serine endoprotease [unclassified Sinorhizobium]MDK1376093.1 DegQ family serine endoprotease [Sinorhizobium sp. 6-70]MDK1480047.1 DegQ family serine endoprotease [Sinorhizobium sp. 6-117]